MLVFVVIRTSEYDLSRNLQCSLKCLFGFSEINIRLHRFFVAWPVWHKSFSQIIHINQISKPTCFNQLKQIQSQVQVQLCIDRRVQFIEWEGHHTITPTIHRSWRHVAYMSVHWDYLQDGTINNSVIQIVSTLHRYCIAVWSASTFTQELYIIDSSSSLSSRY